MMLRKMKLKVITIDFWNTIFDSSGGKERNALRYHTLVNEIAHQGVSVTTKDFENALAASWEYFNDIWINQQRTPKPKDTIEFFWNYLSLPYTESSIDRVTQVFSDSVINYPPKLICNAGPVIRELARSYKLGIVSDTGFTPGVTLQKLLDQHDLLDCFTSFSFSDETGVSKPHPNAFMKVLSELEATPEQSLHIGDIEKTDIKGAKQLGMYAIKFAGDPTTIHRDGYNGTIADEIVTDWADILEIIDAIIKNG